MAEYIIKDKVEWYKCKADITIGDKDFGNTGIVVIPVADISELPTIEIVHCGECKHNMCGECRKIPMPMSFDIFRHEQWVNVKDDFFASMEKGKE